jgi:hypothetical protein
MLDLELNPGGSNHRDEYRAHAASALRQCLTILRQLLRVQPDNEEWITYLASEETMLGSLNQGTFGLNGVQLATAGASELRQSAAVQDSSVELLFRATSAMLTVRPVQLRDSALAVQFAERLATLSHRADPGNLLLLAQAYRANGESMKAVATAREGLRLLPPPKSGMRPIRCQILLQDIIDHPRSL